MNSHIRSLGRPPALVGYARVSRSDQTLALQRDALKAAGCERIFSDHGVSGSAIQRRGLDAVLSYLWGILSSSGKWTASGAPSPTWFG